MKRTSLESVYINIMGENIKQPQEFYVTTRTEHILQENFNTLLQKQEKDTGCILKNIVTMKEC